MVIGLDECHSSGLLRRLGLDYAFRCGRIEERFSFTFDARYVCVFASVIGREGYCAWIGSKTQCHQPSWYRLPSSAAHGFSALGQFASSAKKAGSRTENKNCLLVFQKNDFTKAASSTISIHLYSVFQFRVGKNSSSHDES